MTYSSDKYQFYIDSFKRTKNIEDWLSSFSILIWDKLKFHYQYPGIVSRVSEGQITNELVSGIARLILEDNMPLPIRLFHATNEKANGNDLEIVLELDRDKYIIMPCQAKRLYLDKKKSSAEANYDKMWYRPSEEIYQINSLIEYSQKHESYPLYLLYNFFEGEFDLKSYSYPELFGCTLISALYIGEKYFYEYFEDKLNFNQLHPPAKPVSSLIEISSIEDLAKKWGEFTSLNARVKLYSLHEIVNYPGWIEINPPADTPPRRFTSSIDLNQILLSKEEISKKDEFAPAFRVILTKDVIYHRKRNTAL